MSDHRRSFAIAFGVAVMEAACSSDSVPPQGSAGMVPTAAGSDAGNHQAATAGLGGTGLGGTGLGGTGPGGTGPGGTGLGGTGLGGAAAGTDAGGGGSTSAGSSGIGGQSGAGLGGGAGSPPDTTCGTAKICDDFEAYASGAPPAGIWTFLGPDTKNTGSKTTIMVDATKAFSGKQALHVVAPGGYGGAWVAAETGLPLPNNVMWGRMMIYIHNPSNNHLDFMRASTFSRDGQPVTRDKYIHYALVSFQNGKLEFQYMNAYDSGNGEAFSGSNTRTPQDRWTCIEWNFDGSPMGLKGKSLPNTPPKDELRAWIDGVAHDDMTRVPGTPNACCGDAAKEWTAPPFEMLQLGFIDWQAKADGTVTEEVWIDDIAVGSTRLGCPR